MAQRTFGSLPEAANLNGSDVLAVEQSDATRKVTFESLSKQIYTPEVTEQTGEFPEIKPDDTLPVIAGKIVKWQQDIIKKIETYILQKNIIQIFPEGDFDPENPDDPVTKALTGKVVSALLAYTMNGNILKVVSDHETLQADFEIQKREQMASYGYFGVEWKIDDLMAIVKAGKWDKFAVGDYFIETTSSGEKIMWEVAGKNSYLHCGDTELNKSHIVCCPRDCLETYYKFNTSHTNAGGYAASLMPANLETEANKFSSKLQGYMTTIRRLENNKGTWAWASRRIFLPSIVELCGSNGFADGYSGGAFNQLSLFTGGNAHILKGAGFNKKKAGRADFWTADPSAAGTTNFCLFDANGDSAAYGAAYEFALAPLIVLS